MNGNAVILIADDEPGTRTGLEGLLQAHGYRVTSAPDGKKALEEFWKLKPDLVLLDVAMPEMDGFEVCRRIKNYPETCLTPVVLVTALTETQDRIRGLEAGADDFLSKPIDPSELLTRVRSLLRLKSYTDELERAEAVLLALAHSIEGKDSYTEGHCQRLSEYSGALGHFLGLIPEQITALRRAGILHDIGKVAVPDAILLKRERLTKPEREVMEQHPVVGEHICTPLKAFRQVLPIIRHHHEKFDGSGYPDGLRGEQIPLTARVLQVVDVFDALTTQRSYKPALSPQEALKTMEEEVQKGWWDPTIFAKFRVMLDSNRVARAPQINPSPHQTASH